jgi:pimeloyl-ACP methyl ester carboxylesterase
VPLPRGCDGPGAIGSFLGASARLLRYRVVEAPNPVATVLCLHGIESHGTWFLPAAWRLRALGYTTWLLDRRGSGLNREEDPGDTPSAAALLEDIRRFRLAIGDPVLHLVGLSFGGKLATAAALDRPDRITSLVLVTPGLRARVDLTPAQKVSFALGLMLGGRKRLKIPIKPEMFTGDPDTLAFIRGDPWRLCQVTARFLAASIALGREIDRALPTLRPPVRLFLAGDERIVDNAGILALLRRLPASQVRTTVYEHAAHAIQLEHVDRLVTDLCEHFQGTHAPC